MRPLTLSLAALSLTLALACGGGMSEELSQENWAEASYRIRQTADSPQRTEALELCATGYAAAVAGTSSHWHSTGFKLDAEEAASDGVITEVEVAALQEEMGEVTMPAGVTLEDALAQVQAAEAGMGAQLQAEAVAHAANSARDYSGWTMDDIEAGLRQAGATVDECDKWSQDGDVEIECWATREGMSIHIETTTYDNRQHAVDWEQIEKQSGGAADRDGKTVLVAEVWDTQAAEEIAGVFLKASPRLESIDHATFEKLLKGTSLEVSGYDQHRDSEGWESSTAWFEGARTGEVRLVRYRDSSPSQTERYVNLGLELDQGDAYLEVDILDKKLSEAMLEAVELGVGEARAKKAAP